MKRLVNVSVGQTLSMYTSYGADVEVYLGDILIGTISLSNETLIKNCWRRTTSRIGYIDELFIQ